MRFMVLVKATAASEAGEMPGEELLAAMGRFNEELVSAGVLVAGEGLHPTARGARVRFAAEGGEPTVIDGPFPLTPDLLAGFWVLEVESREAAVAWMRRAPHPMPGHAAELEIRQVFSPDDFGAALTPELREAEDRLRERVEERGSR